MKPCRPPDDPLPLRASAPMPSWQEMRMLEWLTPGDPIAPSEPIPFIADHVKRDDQS